MNCEVCGTELPHGAMFCGECGHAVGARSLARHPDSGMPVVTPSFAPTFAPQTGQRPQPHGHDTAVMEPEEFPVIERGRAPERDGEQTGRDGARATVNLGSPTDLESPTHLGSPTVLGSPVDLGWPLADQVEQDLPPGLDEPGLVEPGLVEPGLVKPEAAAPVPAESPSMVVAPEVPPAAPAQPVIHDLASAPVERPVERAESLPWGDRASSVFLDSEELEQTLIVPRRETGERFVLQFSTGESITVFGTGLLGRNPVPQPGEYFDHLVVISDPGKSVSKTHLEFGQEAGAFWVSDRFSGNGSVVREPEMPVRRLIAGKRYRIVRGTRIDIGEQFLVVS